MNINAWHIVLALSLLPGVSFAASKSVKAKTPSGYQLLALASQDGSVARSTSSGRTTVAVNAGNTGRVYLTNEETGELAANVILAIKKGRNIYTYAEAKARKLCRGNARAVYGFKIPGSTLNLGTIKQRTGWAYTTTKLSSRQLDKTIIGTVTRNCAPTATASSLGMGSSQVQTKNILSPRELLIQAESDDSDTDGLADVFDLDDDNDQIIDSYDPDTVQTEPPPGTVATNLRVFSNIKPEIQSSLNAYTETVTDERINTLVSNVNLAIQVAGGNTLPTELDCGALSYCSAGGTGSNLGQPFPENFDTDADGLGTITEGPTGDFQLTTGASKTSIGAGDVLIQEVDNGDGTSTRVPAMLNFVFNTTPAVSSLVMGSTNYTPVYPATEGMAGSANNPWVAPVGWDQILTITAYRPQRPGISGAGEGAFVDVGNSKISIDIPNLPCTGSGGCSGQNTSRCTGSSYSETDDALAIEGEGLKDLRGDQDTDTSAPEANRVTFSVDLSTCISATWNSGEKLAIDLQFSNDVGDNAAQKFYIQLP